MKHQHTRRGNTQETIPVERKMLLSSPLVGEVARRADEGLSNRKTLFNIPHLTVVLPQSGKTYFTTFLPGYAVLPPQGGQISTTREGRGFTLIELLVVVLIIGVLAAVALPQYNRAVKKAQGKEIVIALKAMDKAFAAYLLENGDFGTDTYHPTFDLNKLSIPRPQTTYFSTGFMSNGPDSQILYFTHKKSKDQIYFEWSKKRNRFVIFYYSKPTSGMCDYLDGGTLQAGSPAGAKPTCAFKDNVIY